MPGLVVSDIFRRVQTTLQDAGATRWPMAELLDALNGCLLAISHAKPSVFAEAIELQLAEGPAQELGAGASQLLRVIRNITSAPGAAPRVGGAAITMANRESLDRRLPGWTDPSVVPYTTAVQHVMTDTEHPELFHVFPGNDGTGVIEVVAAMVPDLITAPADPDDIDRLHRRAAHRRLLHRGRGELYPLPLFLEGYAARWLRCPRHRTPAAVQPNAGHPHRRRSPIQPRNRRIRGVPMTISRTSLDEFLPLVSPYAPNALRPAMMQALRLAAIAYCEKTKCWRETVEIELTEGESAIGPTGNAVIMEIENAWHNGAASRR